MGPSLPARARSAAAWSSRIVPVRSSMSRYWRGVAEGWLSWNARYCGRSPSGMRLSFNAWTTSRTPGAALNACAARPMPTPIAAPFASCSSEPTTIASNGLLLAQTVSSNIAPANVEGSAEEEILHVLEPASREPADDPAVRDELLEELGGDALRSSTIRSPMPAVKYAATASTTPTAASTATSSQPDQAPRTNRLVSGRRGSAREASARTMGVAVPALNISMVSSTTTATTAPAICVAVSAMRSTASR